MAVALLVERSIFVETPQIGDTNGVVNIIDLLNVISAWGPCCPQQHARLVSTRIDL